MTTIAIRGARVIDPASGTDRVLDIRVANGRVATIGRPVQPADLVVDAGGLIAAPGLIDPHVHLREPGQERKETIESGTRAAVAGGFTTVVCMPNTNPAIDSPEAVTFVRHRVEQTALCRVFTSAAATLGRQGQEPTDIEALVRAGAVAITDDGDAVASAGMMRRVLIDCAAAGVPFMQHCQEPTLTQNSAMNAGEVAVRLGLKGWPAVAEELIIERDVRLNRGIGCRYHVQHVSCAGSVEIIRRAQATGVPITAEASPHHLVMSETACEGFNTLAKMNPPLRTAGDIEALRCAVGDGVITVLATDHAPHTADEKDAPFEDAPFGIIGLETALPLYAEALVGAGHIDWPRLIAMMTIEPARLCNLDRANRGEVGLGELFEGGPADIALIDPDLEWTFTLDEVAGMSRNSPFIGRRLKGRAVMTMVGGRIAMNRRAAPAGAV